MACGPSAGRADLVGLVSARSPLGLGSQLHKCEHPPEPPPLGVDESGKHQPPCPVLHRVNAASWPALLDHPNDPRRHALHPRRAHRAGWLSAASAAPVQPARQGFDARAGCRGAAGVGFRSGLWGRRRWVGRLAEKLDQGQDDQQQPGQHQDGLAGGLAPEHQRQRGQDDGGDAQASLRVLLQHVSPIRRRSALNSRCGVAV